VSIFVRKISEELFEFDDGGYPKRFFRARDEKSRIECVEVDIATISS
jgi:hypothetical protein